MNNVMSHSESFRLYLIRKGLKTASINRTVDIVNRYLLRHSTTDVDTLLLKLTKEHKHSYINSIIAAIRNYGHFIQDPKLQEVQFFKQQESEKAIMADDEIERFLALPPPAKNKIAVESYKRLTMFWLLVAYTGARCGEIADLDTNHVDFGRNILMVDGKTGKRYIPISPTLYKPLQSYISQLDSKYLFQSSRTGKPINRATWHWDFCERVKRLGIKRDRLTPHSLRHSFVTRMLNEGVDLMRVQKVVGHKQVTTTAKYMHLTTKDLIETIKRDPLTRSTLTYYDRLKAFREEVRRLLGSYALSPEEERSMIDELF
jgi:site-specific recombinase XerD